MNYLKRKRKAIERGELEEWTARGRRWTKVERSCVPRVLLRAGIRLSGLRRRGKRNALNPVTRHITVEFDTLPETFSGFTILHLSDFHIDVVPEMVDRAGELLSGLEVDLCVLAGDYRYEMNGPSDAIYPPLGKILSAVKARLGIFGILGNHDTTAMADRLRDLGVKFLVNEAMEIRRGEDALWFVGLDDPHYFGCEDLPGALREVPEEAFKILLVHTPEMIEDAVVAGMDLYLCGHTHGGQIRLPLIGPVVVSCKCPRRCRQGLWNYDGLRGYTNSGIGSSMMPARFLCPPEIAVIELRRA